MNAHTMPEAAHPMPLIPPDISKADFRELAILAWQRDPLKPLTLQMAADLPPSIRTGKAITERACAYWLTENNDRFPPAFAIRRAFKLASERLDAAADLLDRLEKAVNALPADDGRE